MQYQNYNIYYNILLCIDTSKYALCKYCSNVTMTHQLPIHYNVGSLCNLLVVAHDC